MTDMTAFERQLSQEFAALMGPVRPVDDAAILSAVTASQSPRWTTRPLFSATRFVVAGAIVALFGGLLLTGVFTRPGDVRQPASVPSATSVPLPSEEVEPGVSRIILEGAGTSVAVGPDGTVWQARRSGATRSVAPLQGSAPPDVPFETWWIDVGPDGVVWAAGSSVAGWDGRDWTVWLSAEGYQPKAVFAGPDGAANVPWFSADGSDVEGYTDARIWVEEMTVGDGGTRPGEALTLGPASVPGISRVTENLGLAFAATPDGEVWAVVPYGATSPSGEDGRVWRWDGQGWHAQAVPGIGSSLHPLDVAAGSDGTVWVYFADDRSGQLSGRQPPAGVTDARRLARFRDGGWTLWTEDDGVPRVQFQPPQRMAVDQAGAVWMLIGDTADCPGLSTFDGAGWGAYLADTCITDMAAGPDGSVWVAGYTPGRDSAIYRVIPKEAGRASPGVEPSPDGSPDAGA